MKKFDRPIIDPFESLICHQLKSNVAYKPDPKGIGKNAMQQNWNFCVRSKVLVKIIRDKVNHLIIVTAISHTHTWYTQLLCMSKQNPLLLTQVEKLYFGQIQHLII